MTQMFPDQRVKQPFKIKIRLDGRCSICDKSTQRLYIPGVLTYSALRLVMYTT